MTPQETKLFQQFNDRLVRMESRIVQLGDYVGANLRSKQRIEVEWGLQPGNYAAGRVWLVTIDALDVSLSRVLDELRRSEADYGHVPVFCNGEKVATVLYSAKPKEIPHGQPQHD